MATQFEDLKRRKAQLESDLAALEMPLASKGEVAAEVESAVGFALRLGELANSQNMAEAREAIELANVRLYVRFKPVQVKRRLLNRIAGGVVTLGAAPPPFTPYEGPTSRSKLKNEAQGVAIATQEDTGRRSPTTPNGSGREGSSLGNVNRDNRTAIELFLAGTASLGGTAHEMLRARRTA